MKERDSNVDVAKGICILLIVCIHTEVFAVIGMPFTFIAVPMFFFMSGFYDHSEKPLKEWFPKNLITLILPAIIWCVLGKTYSECLTFIKDHQFSPIDFNLFNPCEGNGPAWFLFALMYAKIIVRRGNNIPNYILLPISFVIGYAGSRYQMPLLLDEGMAAFPLYYTGKLLYPHIRSLYCNKWFVILGLIALTVFLMHFAYYTIVPLGNGCYSPCYILAILFIMLVFIPVLLLSEKMKTSKVLQNLGTHSLGIMLLHAPMCHTAAVILNRVFNKGSVIWIVCFLVAYIAIVILSYYLTVIIEKYCPVLLGKK